LVIGRRRQNAQGIGGAPDPEGPGVLCAPAQRMERSGTPESPVSGAVRRKCAQQNYKAK
jgi:hypothetical protein